MFRIRVLSRVNVPTRRCTNIARLSTLGNFWNESTRSPYLVVPYLAVVGIVATISNERLENRAHLEAVHVDDKVQSKTEADGDDDQTTKVINWSGTHSVIVSNDHYWEPESIQEVEAIVRKCHEKGQPVRPIGSSLSPNGLALNGAGMISMAHLDKILHIDKENMTITTQAGATVNQVVEALRPHGLTLPNLASIAEQQMGGFTQVGAHGTGKRIAPVDHYVTKLKLVTPALGTIELTRAENEALFELAKVGLGCLGVVVEITMECIPAHQLVEHTFVLSRKEAKEQVDFLLKKHKHMRYMWIPYTDAVVVVTNDPEDQVPADVPRKSTSEQSPEEKARPLTNLLEELSKGTKHPVTRDDMKGMGFGELRDAILAFDPLNIDHVKVCNSVEAEFWKCNEGYQTQPSDKLLQFDCGGQQWVFEVCFCTGTQEKNNGNDMDFMDRLLKGIEDHKIPAHSPIEQRWSASSSSLMSPATGPPGGLYSWVGVINYLPSDDPKQRKEITDLFLGRYCDLVREVGRPVVAVSHWAKLEDPSNVCKTVTLRMLMQNRYPVAKFNAARATLDPKNILASPLIDKVFGKPK